MKYLIVVLTLVLVAPATQAAINNDRPPQESIDEIVVIGVMPSGGGDWGGLGDWGGGGWSGGGGGGDWGNGDGGGGGGMSGTGGDGSDGSDGDSEDEGEPIPEIIVVGHRLTVFLPDPDDLLEPDPFVGSILTELSERASLAIEELASTVDDMTLAEACEAAEMAVYDACLDEAQNGYMICTAGSTAISLFASIFVSAASDFLCDRALDNIVAHCDAGEFPSPLGGYSTDQFNIVGCP